MIKNKKIKKRLFFILVFFLLIVGGFSYAYIEAKSIALKKMIFISKDIPISFDEKRIIFISDIHFGKYFNKSDLQKLVRRINEEKPDFIFLGGDYIEKESIYSSPFFEEIKKLNSKYGVFTVLGNHDFWEDQELIKQGLKDCGFNLCDNQSYWIKEGNDSLKIGGVGEFWEDNQIIGNTIDDVKQDDFCILLSHNPDYMEVLDTDKVDLMLSGHTHAGQITFFGIYAPIMPSSWHPEYLQTGQKYRYGWIEKNETKLYVTSGIGTGSFPFRFFARPEIVEITIKRSN